MPKRSPATRRLARPASSADFERALGARRHAATAHFALHHAALAPVVAAEPLAGLVDDDLSTGRCETGAPPVDDCVQPTSEPARHWLGAVVPKRHARRAVTRSLLKRQIYAAGERHRAHLGDGVWVVRQRAPFDRAAFPSAASEALKQCARAELETLFEATRR